MIPPPPLPAPPRVRVPLLALAVLLVLGAGAARARAEPPAPKKGLQEVLAALATDRRIAPARVGFRAVEPGSDRTVAELRATEAFNVASNVKLVTSAAALELLGPAFQFKTAAYAAGRKGGVAQGDLFLKGFGDPSFSEPDLYELVCELWDAGVRSVEGGVVIDETYFDDERLPPLFDSKDTEREYRAPVGALSLNQNAISVRVIAGEAPGEQAVVLVRPRSSHLKVKNATTTVSTLRRSWVDISTRTVSGTTEILVRGRVRLGYTGKPFRRRISDPGLLAGHAFLDLLAQRGIHLGRPRVTRGAVPSGLTPLAVKLSEPLPIILRGMNKQSNNFVAEQVLKVLGAEVFGRPASSKNGLRAVARYLAGIGLPEGSYVLKNGSGLYDSSRFSPAQIVRVLRHAVLDFRIAADYLSSLAIAGSDGTLEHRFLGSGVERLVRAKTGTLAHIVTLSGFAGTPGDQALLAFSICVDGLPEKRVLQARAVVDEMAAALVAHLGDEAAARRAATKK
jgi:serine-type D-Ala-D-Ala carboxypeptidase/endopeptidase (penicillin-binding protein 4)